MNSESVIGYILHSREKISHVWFKKGRLFLKSVCGRHIRTLDDIGIGNGDGSCKKCLVKRPSARLQECPGSFCNPLRSQKDCGSEKEGTMCTRARGHVGPHIHCRHLENRHNLLVWENTSRT